MQTAMVTSPFFILGIDVAFAHHRKAFAPRLEKIKVSIGAY